MEKNDFTLHSFTVKNFRSIKDEQTISLESNRVAAIFGANASGKTNFIRALQFVCWFVANSANAGIEVVPYDPFRLNVNTRNQPSTFSIKFGNNNETFRYEFSVSDTEVRFEELVDLSSSRPKVIFTRENNNLNPSASKYGFGKQLLTSTRKNTLILTKAQENNNPYAQKVFTLIQSLRTLVVGDGNLKAWGATIIKNNPQAKERVLEYLREADLWIRDFLIDEIDMPEDIINALPINDEEKNKIRLNRFTSIQTEHAVRDDEGNLVGIERFDMGNNESQGTNNFFDMIMPIIETLDNNLMLYIDEFGSSLHPDLAKLIIHIFKNTPESSAQLIVNTHDESLMDESVLDVNEIFLIEKTRIESSVIKKLKESPGFRSTDVGRVEKRYRTGLYGARPRIKEE